MLPLENVSGDRQQEYFADGMTDALIGSLARIPGLRVTSRTSTMSFKGATKKIPEIGRALGVQAVAEGSVVRAGSRVRIMLRLMDAPGNRAIWSENYDSEFSDVLALLTQAAEALAKQVHVKTGASGGSRPPPPKHVNQDAYDAYLKGRYAQLQGNVEQVLGSVQLFKKALGIDPAYALGYAGLAQSYLVLSGVYMTPVEAMAKAKAAATRALELDPNLPEAHLSLGIVHGWFEFDWNQAQAQFKRALELDASNAEIRLWYGQSLIAIGQAEEGIRQIRVGHQSDPLSAFVETGLGQMYFLSRQYERAIQQLRNVVTSDPAFPNGHMFLGVAYLYTKQYSDAIGELQKAIEIDANQPQPIAYLAYAQARMGDRQAAARNFQKLHSLKRNGYVSGYLFALASLGMESNDAIEWLRRAYDDRDDMLAWLKTDALLDPLRTDPGFKLLMRQVGFE